jgi:hypothetical protein
MRIISYGIPDGTLGPGRQFGHTVSHGQHQIDFRDRAPTLDLSGADLFVLPASMKFEPGDTNQDRNAQQLAVRQIGEAVSHGAKLALCCPPGFPVSMEFGVRVLDHYYIQADSGLRPGWRHPIFATYLTRYEVRDGIALMPQREDIDLLSLSSVARRTEEQYGACALPIGLGLLYIVPANLVAGNEARLIAELATAIERHADSVLRPATAPIIDSFVFGNESGTRADRDAARVALERLEAELEQYNAKKDILFLRGDALTNRLCDWIPANLHIRTSRTEEFIEDLMLVGADTTPFALCEVKAVNGNVQRDHVYQVAKHRAERGKPEEFPALLIANTFADTATVQERQPVGANEIMIAAKNNVLIVRTLDLLFLSDQIERRLVARGELLELITTESGWLRANADAYDVVKN